MAYDKIEDDPPRQLVVSEAFSIYELLPFMRNMSAEEAYQDSYQVTSKMVPVLDKYLLEHINMDKFDYFLELDNQ